MTILGIETSCDETSVALVEAHQQRNKETKKQRNGSSVSQFLGFSVLSNIVASQVKIHAKYGGVVPEVAARKHVETILPVLEQALRQAQGHKNYSLSGAKRSRRAGLRQAQSINYKDIDAIAVAAGPGLITSLLVGTEVAKVLSYLWQKPLVAINHIEAHIYANWLTPVSEFSISNFQFPILCLVVSGGHTELILMRGHGEYEVIGETRDDAAGECFDKTAKILGLGYPGGPAVAAEAEKLQITNYKLQINSKFKIQNSKFKSTIGNRKSTICLPRPMIDSPDFDFSFSGLKTAVLYSVRDLKNKYKMEEIVPAMAREIQEAVVDVLVEKTIRAAKKYNIKTVMLAGGVSANRRLRERFVETMRSGLPNTKYQIPDTKYCTDNAAMIAAAGYFHAARRDFAPWQKLKVNPNWEL